MGRNGGVANQVATECKGSVWLLLACREICSEDRHSLPVKKRTKATWYRNESFPLNISVLIGVFPSGNMGKNKQKGKKQKNVFQVANKHLKSKNKAKAVTTTLKHVRSLSPAVLPIRYVFYPACSVCCTCSSIIPHSQINGGKKEKVESLNQIFTEVQRDVKSVSKSVAPEPKKQTQVEERVVHV